MRFIILVCIVAATTGCVDSKQIGANIAALGVRQGYECQRHGKTELECLDLLNAELKKRW